MKEFQCSFGTQNWLPINAVSADIAAKQYVENNSTLLNQVEELLKAGYHEVHVLNVTDAVDEGWFRVDFLPVVIADVTRIEEPSWVEQYFNKQKDKENQ